jgi:hypothetical protein
MTGSYSVQTSVARTICETHVKTWTVEIMFGVHTIKFHRNRLKFVGDESV